MLNSKWILTFVHLSNLDCVCTEHCWSSCLSVREHFLAVSPHIASSDGRRSYEYAADFWKLTAADKWSISPYVSIATSWFDVSSLAELWRLLKKLTSCVRISCCEGPGCHRLLTYLSVRSRLSNFNFAKGSIKFQSFNNYMRLILIVLISEDCRFQAVNLNPLLWI